MGQISTGMYQTACEASPRKQQIDMWINEDKPNAWISRELAKLGEKISDKSIAKYRAYRNEYIDKKLQEDPVYQGQIQKANEVFIESASKIKAVDVLQHLVDTIETCADMIEDAKLRDVQIKSAQDMRFMHMTMLDAIKLYGDTILKAQKFSAIEDNPELLKPQTININVKSALTDVLKEVMKGGSDGFALIDKLRAGIGGDVGGGIQGDPSTGGSSIVDGDTESTQGETIFVSES
jgi:hypothetical protein